MPKTKPTLFKYVEENKNVFSTDGKILFCKACEKSVNGSRTYLVEQHLNTIKHKENVKRKGNVGSQSLLFSSPQNQQMPIYSQDLCDALVAADIPLWKLKNPILCKFLEKYTNKIAPDESTLRKNYLPKSYEYIIEKIRKEIGENYIWVSVDETTDVEGRNICNFIVGTLHAENVGKSFVLNCECLAPVNHATIAQFFTNSLQILWPQELQYNKVLLLLTDGAPYMIKAGKGLKVIFNKMIHVTCLAHALHLTAESIRACHSGVDNLIASTKKVFKKAPYRVRKFKEMTPTLPLPPSPILTRWGTWLKAAFYYAENFDDVKAVIDTFNKDYSASIKQSQNLFSSPAIKFDLSYIQANFKQVTNSITKLETSGLRLTEALDVIQEVRETLQAANGETGKKASEKLEQLLKKNLGFSSLVSIGNVLKGEIGSNTFESDMAPSEIASFKYAPITSCDVERSFSRYKATLRDNRRSFAFPNLKMAFVIQCNSSLL
jgi:hypothetical protein